MFWDYLTFRICYFFAKLFFVKVVFEIETIISKTSVFKCKNGNCLIFKNVLQNLLTYIVYDCILIRKYIFVSFQSEEVSEIAFFLRGRQVQFNYLSCKSKLIKATILLILLIFYAFSKTYFQVNLANFVCRRILTLKVFFIIVPFLWFNLETH